MSQWTNIFGFSDEALPREELEDVAAASWYGDDSVTFSWEPEDDTGSSWTRFEMLLPGSRRPVVIQRDVDRKMILEIAQETLGELDQSVPEAISVHLADSVQIISLEFAPDQLGDDAWELHDILVSFIAQRINGLVVADDGIYDKDLTCLIER